MNQNGFIKKLTSFVSVDRILDNIAWITRFHRMQASPDLLRAAEYAVEQFESYGLEAELVRIPIGDWVGGVPGFDGWECRDAELWLEEPEMRKLADWHENKFSLIQRSAPIDGVFDVTADKDGDLSGKFLLTDDMKDITRVHKYIDRGAVGIIFYGIGNSSIDLPDARRYLSFWWTRGYQRKISGFTLTYRQGLYLKGLLAQGKQVKGRARVDSRFYDGTFDIATAVLRGESPEEIVLTAHICHPKNEANDNASGAGVVMEVARVLSHLVANGTIKRPVRSIRFILVPEINGSNAFYLERPETARNGLMGLNFDMVGSNLKLSRGVMLLDKHPAVLGGYSSALVNRLRRRFVDGVKNWLGTAYFNNMAMETVPFGDGTDHLVLSDPHFGIPAPTMINWPDRYYHTDHDTIDKLSGHSLRMAAATGVAFAFMTGNPGGEHMRCAADSVLLDTIEDIHRVLNDELDRLDAGMSSSMRFMAMLKRIAQQGYDNLKAVRDEGFDVAGHETLISNYVTDLIKIYENRFDSDREFLDKSLYPNDKTPVRKVKGVYYPWSWIRENRPDLAAKWDELSDEAARDEHFMSVPHFAYLWFDGNKNTREVAFDLASVYGKPIHPEQYRFYLELLADLDFIELK